MLPYMMNFDLSKVATLNKKGLAKYEEDKANRKDKKEKITRMVIDSDDILILRFIYTVGQEPKTIRDTNDKNFFWVKYDALFAEYEGLLLINKSALNTRLNKYVDMNLIERKCVKNEDGSFSFFKLTGVKDLIYIPVKEEKKAPEKANKKNKEVKKANVDSNGQKPLEGQINDIEAIEIIEDVRVNLVNEKITNGTASEELINIITNKSIKEVREVINNINGKFVTSSFIENAFNKVKPQNNFNEKIGFNNFEPRTYDYDSLERKLLGWE